MKKTILSLALLAVSFLGFSKIYKGAEVQSVEEFHFGRFETRFYSSNVSGMLSTFFLFEKDGWQDCCLWQEIDIEVFGKDGATSWQSNPIWETEPAQTERSTDEEVHVYDQNGKANQWHTYTLDWTADYIEWFVDGKSIRKFTDKEALKFLGAKPMKMMMNIWTSHWTDWTGPFNGSDAPTYQFVDYVKVYDWNKGTTTFKQEPRFVDDFDKNLDKWTLSNHSFEGNLCDFEPENVVLKDGNLILAFTKEGETGAAGVRIPIEPTNGDEVELSVFGKDATNYPAVTGALDVSEAKLTNGDKVTIYDKRGKRVGTYEVKDQLVSTVKYFGKGTYFFVEEGKKKATVYRFEKQ